MTRTYNGSKSGVSFNTDSKGKKAATFSGTFSPKKAKGTIRATRGLSSDCKKTSFTAKKS